MATCYVTDPRTRMGRTRQDLRALLIAPATATLCPANIVVCDMGIRTFLRAAVRTSSILAPPLARRLFPDAYAPGGRSGPLRRDPSIASHTSGAIAARRANVLHRYLQPWFGWTLGSPPPKKSRTHPANHSPTFLRCAFPAEPPRALSGSSTRHSTIC